MKANRRARCLHSDERAVSTVIGGILLFGLFVMTLVTVRVQYVPAWDKQREEDLMVTVSEQLALINADLMRQIGDATAGSSSNALQLGKPAGPSLFTSPSPPGTLSFTPSEPGQGLKITAPELTAQHRNGMSLMAFNEQWNAVGQGASVTDIAGIDHLRMRINEPGTYTGWMNFRFTDAAGNYQARIDIDIWPTGGNGHNVQTSTYGVDSETEPLSSHFKIYVQQGCGCPQDYHYVDALEDVPQFKNVLQTLDYPVTMTMTKEDINGSYAIVYQTPTADGTARVGEQGVVLANYNVTAPGGVLALARNNQQFPAQTYSLEYGAMFVDQEDGAVMATPPSFSVSAAPNQTSIYFEFPALAGDRDSVFGTAAATVIATASDDGLSVEGLAPRVDFELTTTHPTLWEEFWDKTLRRAGLNASAGEYVINTTTTTATLSVFGPVAAPADMTRDIFVTYSHSNVKLRLAATG